MVAYLREFAALPYGAVRFIATETLLGIGIGILNLILNLHCLAIGLDPRDIGEITSAGTIAMGLCSFPSGTLVSKLGRKPMLVCGLSLMAVSCAGFGLALGKMDMLLAQLGWSAGLTFLVTSEIQLLFQYCPDKKTETQAFSLLFAIFTLFTGVGTLLGGYLPKLLGGSSSEYQYTFFAGAACIALGALLRGLLLPSASVRRAANEHAGKEGAAPEGPRPLRKLLVLSVSVFLAGFTFNLAGPYVNVILQYRYGWSDEAVSLLLSGVGVSLFVGSLMMPAVLERLGTALAFSIVFLLNIAFAALLGSPVGAGAFSAVLLVRGGCFTLLNNMLDSESMSAVSERERNRFAGMRTVFRSAGSALAAYIGGAVLEARATQLPFLLTSAALLAGWIWFMRMALPAMKRKPKEAFTETAA